jgi:uncharacterized membrane protein YdbT with pleckstrin-like domain
MLCSAADRDGSCYAIQFKRGMAEPMASRNQVPNLTPRGKAARRRSWAWSAVLFVVVLACVALTVFVWVSRAAITS